MKAILACDPSGGIGYKNKLPWTQLQGDLPRFKSLTDGQVIIMGRNTWLSLPKKPLPNRLNIVVSSNKLDLAITTNNIEHFVHFKHAWLIGGASLITSCWHLIDEIHLSRTIAQYTCDTFIDLIKLENEFSLSLKDSTPIDHQYEIWVKK
jgi:dihydrofolate reductase